MTYARARSVDEALALLEGDGAVALAGGTLVVPEGVIDGFAGDVVDISGVADLRAVREDGDGVHVGALANIARLEAAPFLSPGYAALSSAAASIGNPHIRRAGTVGGNVACRLARACLPPALLALDAEVLLVGPGSSARRPIGDVLHDGLPPGWLISAVRLPPQGGRRSAYTKFEWRRATAKAIVTVAVSVDLRDGTAVGPRLAVGGLCVPRRLPGAERLLAGRKIDPASLDEVARAAAEEPPFTEAPTPPGEAYRRRLVAYGVRQLLTEIGAS